MHDFCRGEPVEVRGRGDRVGPDIFRIDEIADRELRELGRERDRIECIAGRPEDCRDVARPFLEREYRVGAVVEDLPRVGMVDAVVDVIAGLAVPVRLPDDLCNERAGICHEEPARLGKDLHVGREEPGDLGPEFYCKFFDGTDLGVVLHGKASADIEDPDLLVQPVLRLRDDIGRDLERDHVVLEVGALASHVET